MQLRKYIVIQYNSKIVIEKNLTIFSIRDNSIYAINSYTWILRLRTAPNKGEWEKGAT